jgi:hypothetical protein
MFKHLFKGLYKCFKVFKKNLKNEKCVWRGSNKIRSCHIVDSIRALKLSNLDRVFSYHKTLRFGYPKFATFRALQLSRLENFLTIKSSDPKGEFRVLQICTEVFPLCNYLNRIYTLRGYSFKYFISISTFTKCCSCNTFIPLILNIRAK